MGERSNLDKRGNSLVDTIKKRQNTHSSTITIVWTWVFPVLVPLLLLAPLFLLSPSKSHYNEKPISDRRLNLRGLELITTNYLNEHPEAFDKLIRIVTNADEALQEEEFPARAAVMKWLDLEMEKEGFTPEMPVYYYLKTVYLDEWEDAYFHQIDDGEREYLYDLLSAMIGGLYRCTCAPAHLRSS